MSLGWESVTLPDPHILSVDYYFDQRVPEDDEDAIEMQQHQVVVKEYRGLTYALADSSAVPVVYSNGYKTFSVQAIPAGGYNLVEVIDMTVGGWIKVKYTIS